MSLPRSRAVKTLVEWSIFHRGVGGGGVSRARSNWFHAVAITLPRTVKSSKWGCARAPHMSSALGHTRGHYLLPRVSLH